MSNQKGLSAIEDNVLVGKKIGYLGMETIHVGQLMLDTLKSNLGCVAQVDAETGKEVTFWEIRNNSVKLAIWLKFEGIYPGDLIGVSTDFPEAMCAILACMYIGAVPIVRKYDDREGVSSELMDCNPKIIFINRIQCKQFEIMRDDKISDFFVAPSLIIPESSKFMQRRYCFAYDTLIANLDKQYTQEDIDAFRCTKLDLFRLQTAMIIYTRGTEGSPKAVKVSHKSLFAPVNHDVFAVLPGTVGMLVNHHFLYLNLMLAIHSMWMYKRVIIFKGDDMMQFWRAIEKYKVNWVRLETNMSQAILDSKDLLTTDTSSLKMLMFSGSNMKYSTHVDLDRLLPETSITSLYGTTETGIISFQISNRKFGSSGSVSRNTHVMITDVSGTLLDSNIPGKIWCKCFCVLNKYYDPDRASTKITRNNGWYETGDVGYYDNDGDIYVINRAADLIYFKGIYFSPTLIENLIKEHPGVNDVAVVSKSGDKTNEQVLVAFITKKAGKQVTKQEMINIITNIVWDCMQLEGGVVLLDKMPYRLDGNIDRNYLRNKTSLSEDTFAS